MAKAKKDENGSFLKMRICHVSFGKIGNANPSEWLKSIPYFTTILSAMGEKHAVFSFHYAPVTEVVVFKNVTYQFLKTEFIEILTLQDLTSRVRSLNPDAIIIHGLHSSLTVNRFTSRLKDFKIFGQHHGEKLFKFPKSSWQKRADKNVSGYFFSSKEIGNEWVRAGLIKSSKKILEALEVTSSFSVSSKQNTRPEKLNFIWVGRLETNKDPLTLINGFISFLRIYPGAKLFMLFSSQDLLKETQAAAQDFKSNIHLVGQVRHSEMPGWYQKADFIISTSLFEAGGVSVLEGISQGCIPILCDIPSFRKISDEGKYAILFSRQSPAALTDALLQAARLNVPDKRENLLNHFANELSPIAIANQIVTSIADYFQKEKSSALLKSSCP